MASSRLLIRAGTVLTLDPQLSDLSPGEILVEDGKIVAVGNDLGATDVETIDAGDSIVMPGFVDTHRHTWQSVIRNIAVRLDARPVPDRRALRHEPALPAAGHLYRQPAGHRRGARLRHHDAARLVAQPGDARARRRGGPGAVRVRARARCSPTAAAPRSGRSPSELPHTDDVLRIRRPVLLLRRPAGDAGSRRCAARSSRPARPRCSTGSSPAELGCPITVHVGDGEWGKTRPVAWLDENGLMGPEVTYVHCNTLADDELQMIADTGGSASVSADIETSDGPRLAGHRPAARRRDPAQPVDRRLRLQRRRHVPRDEDHDQRAARPGERRRRAGPASRTTHRAHLPRRRRTSPRCRARAPSVWRARSARWSPGKQADIIVIRRDGRGDVAGEQSVRRRSCTPRTPGVVDTVLVAGGVVKRDGRLVADLERVRRLAYESRDYLFSRGAADPAIAGARAGGAWIPEPMVAKTE